jgi:hypothetical protein
MSKLALPFIPIMLLALMGCQENAQQPDYTQLTLSIYNSGVVAYDSVFATVTHAGQITWQGSLSLSGSYYQAIVNVSAGSGYSAQGWVYAEGVRCYAGGTQGFSIAEGEQKYIPINLVAQLPTAPYSLNAAAVSPTQINLTWADTSSLVTDYRIERGHASLDSLVEVATVGKSVRSYQNPGLFPNSLYIFRIRSHNPAGYSAYSNIDSTYSNP